MNFLSATFLLLAFFSPYAKGENLVVFKPEFNVLTTASGSKERQLVDKINACGSPLVSKNGEILLIEVELLECTGLLSEGPLAKSIAQEAFSILDEYATANPTDGSVNMFKTFLERAKVYTSPYGSFLSHESIGNPRAFAISIATQTKNIVIVNESNVEWITKYEFGKYMVFHELFGAVGLMDFNYSATLNVWERINEPARDDERQCILCDAQKISPGFGPMRSNPGSINNTGTIIGHGGDFFELMFMIELKKRVKALQNEKIEEALKKTTIATADLNSFEIGNHNFTNNIYIFISSSWAESFEKGEGHQLVDEVLKVFPDYIKEPPF